jgi:4-amino-4-deoxy-L-arabinose transferase-like glycosyltransferase
VPPPSRFGSWSVPLALALLACAVCASTWHVFGHIWDEPEHIAAGMVLIDKGEYVYDDQHPPLARLAAAIGPYLAGARSHGSKPPSGEEEGRQILYHSAASYDTLLTLARAGMLPFLIVLVLSTWKAAERWQGQRVATVATLALISTPEILGHGSIAALDMPVTALCLLSFLMLVRWVESPTTLRAVLAGIAIGLAVSTKLSAVPFLGLAVLVLLTVQITFNARNRTATPYGRLGLTGALIALLAIVILVGVYGPKMIYLTTPDLAYNKALDALFGHEGWLHDVGYRFASRVRMPIGVQTATLNVLGVEWHNNVGHNAYLLGETSRHGWWYFYLVALAVKTPLPLLLLGLPGLVILAVRGWQARQMSLLAIPLWFLAVLVFCCAYSHINIGVRHVLLLYPLLAIGAAATLDAAWRVPVRPVARVLTAALFGWQLATAAVVYPDYLAYFNFTAGAHPERILVDSDLDWGQDLRRLSLELARRHVPMVHVAYRGTADLTRENLPPFDLLKPGQPATGWIAVDMLAMKEEPTGYAWLRSYTPVQRVGKSIDLYYIP